MRWNIQNAEGKCERRKQSREGSAAREMGRERTNGIDQDEGAGKAEQHLRKVEEREELIKGSLQSTHFPYYSRASWSGPCMGLTA